MTQHTLKTDRATRQKMKTFYQDHLIQTVPYAEFRAKYNNVTITAYQSGKVLFQGAKATEEASRWENVSTPTPTKSKKRSSSTLPNNLNTMNVIGCDESGKGSYFGALTVCAVYLPADQHALMTELGVKDSKDLSDTEIKTLASQIKACVPYELITVNPVDYNRGNQTYNVNALLALTHNLALIRLLEKVQPEPVDYILMDQFVAPRTYFNYLKEQPKIVKDTMLFTPRGESAHLAVACASIIARDAFVQSLETLGKKYHMTLPSGAGQQVDLIGAQLVKKYGPNVLQEISKYKFKNTEKILALK